MSEEVSLWLRGEENETKNSEKVSQAVHSVRQEVRPAGRASLPLTE
jgi:hypothetical protein